MGNLPKEGRELDRERGNGGGTIDADNEERPSQLRSMEHSVRRRVNVIAPVEPILNVD
jgi:hypothetical protein